MSGGCPMRETHPAPFMALTFLLATFRSLTLMHLLLLCLPVLLYFGVSFLFKPYFSSRPSDKPYSLATDSNVVEAPLPSASSPPSSSLPVSLSLVIPAYNEEQRLPIMLDATLSYLRSPANPYGSDGSSRIEVIVVDDGSRDDTGNVVESYSQTIAGEPRAKGDGDHVTLRLLRLLRNGGKGAAVRAGCLAATGRHILMLDADGATDIKDLSKLHAEMSRLSRSRSDSGLDPSWAIVVGSRAHLQDESSAQRSLVRTVLMHGFHFFVSFLCAANVRDTQCGFKLFTSESSAALFGSLHLERWAFDVELLSTGQRMGMAIAEVGVNWREVDGSKLDTGKLALMYHSVGMLRDMLCVHLCFALGLWKVPKTKKTETAEERKNK